MEMGQAKNIFQIESKILPQNFINISWASFSQTQQPYTRVSFQLEITL